jgi:ABC-type anion transport system duplicated permease subunit
MFRARVAAQGFTVIAMVAGSMYYSQDRQKSKELRKVKEQHDAEVKRQSWIRELEVRDEEEKALRARLQQRAQKQQRQKATSAEDSDANSGADEEKEPTGGILGKMGLWSAGEKAAAEAAEAEDKDNKLETAAAKKRRDNPKSSLGAIGEAMTSKKKDEEPKK